MKKICDIVEDLLLLYEEGECSEGSRELVEEHLKTCENCRIIREKMRLTDELTVLSDNETDNAEEKVISKGFRKIKRRWMISIIAVLMVFLIVGIGIFVRNEIRKEGICFSNLQEIAICRKWAKLIEEEKFEEAAGMVNYSADYASIMEAYEWHKKQVEDNAPNAQEDLESFMEYYADEVEMTLEEYEAARIEDFVVRLNAYKNEGCHMYYRGFSDAYRRDEAWNITIRIEENDNISLMTFYVEDENLYGRVASQGNSYLNGGILGRVNFDIYETR